MKEWKNLTETLRSIPGNGSYDPGLAIRLLDEAERRMQAAKRDRTPQAAWIEYLNATGRKHYLKALPDREARLRWAETAFFALQQSGYGLREMMENRTLEHPDQVLFKDMSMENPVDWTYLQIHLHLQEIAALFYRNGPHPRVALYTENCLEGACTDLACLAYGIFDTPLSPHFREEVLLSIFDRLGITIALADTEDRLTLLAELQGKTRLPFSILSLRPPTQKTRDIPYLVEEAKQFSRSEIDATLHAIPPRPVTEVATTLFTSGSTGLPKGVSFSEYTIVSKRFARAAALPEVGEETFLCYLPLFHTFGRFLELTGAIFWHGTYIFAGNTSAETLLSLFPRLHPSGFISIPLRWQELYEKCQERISGIASRELRERAVREVTGTRLHWGLSAAGYLDPRVFRFFNQYGIGLNSGFGMTEATGGITMTPPGMYRDMSVGIPLPGVRTRLTENSELELSGHYIARYLETAGPGDSIPFPVSPEKDAWLPTGDVFRVSDDGFFEIIDRVKDIYKNNRGQTVAPQVIEKKFAQVPGILHVFLVGDNRPYNVLLIVPDREDPILRSLKGENLTEYFHQIVMAANADVAPYERVVNYTLLDRDFSAALGEITPKGSFNRKMIEEHFRELIESLYQGNIVTLDGDGIQVSIPKWFFRDLGILETDILFTRGYLVNRRNGKRLRIRRLKKGWYHIGNLRYRLLSETLDMGIFCRQPRLWTGNPDLIDFCPVKEGWDVDMRTVEPGILVPRFGPRSSSHVPAFRTVKDQALIDVNHLLFKTCYGTASESAGALAELGSRMGTSNPRLALLIRSRLEALAYHPSEEVRCLAYRLILLRSPNPEEIRSMPSFIESGLTFLNEESIREIAASNFGKHRLDALKQRLHWYRTHLRWPAGRRHRKAFADVLGMLFRFAGLHLDYYVPIRAELSRWILHKQDRYLSKLAEKYFFQLAELFEKAVDRQSIRMAAKEWKERIVFENGISDTERTRIMGIFSKTSFLHESILLTFRESDFDPHTVPGRGIWVMRLLAFKEFKHYRLAINTQDGRHYDLHMVMSEDPAFRPKPDTFYWLASLAGFPHGPSVAPMPGSSRPNLGVMTTQYIGGLTAWDRIRELAEIHRASGTLADSGWRKIFIRSFTVIFKAWENSGRQIVPGAISPTNIAIPEMDFREGAVILSLAGWVPWKNTLSLVEPMLQDFYCKTAAIYPWSRNILVVSWIFDACIEALGRQKAERFFATLRKESAGNRVSCFDESAFIQHVDRYLLENQGKYYLPLALFDAIDQYRDWVRINPLTAPAAREQTCQELLDLYRLKDHAEVERYYLYRHTCFAEASEEQQTAFDRLLSRMIEQPEKMAIQFPELSDLHSCLTDTEEKRIFSRMVFPRFQGGEDFDFIQIKSNQQASQLVRFSFQDKSGRKYNLREPMSARETGQLYQLFYRENYPKEISANDHQYVLADEEEKIVGGITYRTLEDRSILLDGIVVTGSLQGKGVGSGMMEHFFAGMAAQGAELVRAHFLFGNYYLKHLFDVDKNWGALIKKLK